MRTALRFSAAKAEASASVSCARRERLRTSRPEPISGKTMIGMATSTRPDSFGLDSTISAMAPTNMKRLRNRIEAEAPKADFSCVVSAVRRDTSSPTRAES